MAGKKREVAGNCSLWARWFPYFYSSKRDTCAKMKTSPVIPILWHGYALIVLL
ncbi:MAG: hypothetical protein OXM61_23910 [Candidatus Poribacteria bacterium]|nr:hypothetical protein [Candidatus Poribacteria bacterium]